MILSRLSLLLLIAILPGCDMTPKLPGADTDRYPSIIQDSSERRATAEREWRRMLDAYSISPIPPDLYPIIYTPKSLVGADGIKILTVQPQPGTEDIAAREAVKGFIDRWRELIGADPAAVSLMRAGDGGDSRRFTYRQANYPFPVAGEFGELVAVITEDGRLVQLDARFIPVVEVPVRPQIDKGDVAARVVGRSFTYSDTAGREAKIEITDVSQVTVNRAVVLPLEKGNSIEVRLAWEVVAGTGTAWTIYIDAMNGEELRVVQNFNT